MNIEIHDNVTADLDASDMDAVNALERVILAAAAVGDHAQLRTAVPRYAELTGGSRNANDPTASPLTYFFMMAADGAEPMRLIHALTNILGHGDTDGHLA